jgi:hypothetical protein
MNDERIQKLDEIGMIWENKTDFIWTKKFRAAKTYYEEYGDLAVTDGYINSEGFELGKWISSLRTSVKYDKPWLSKEKNYNLTKSE